MTRQRNITAVVRIAAFSVFGLGVPVFAQAWVPDKGDGSVWITYSNMYVRNHVSFDGTRNPNGGRVRTNLILTSVEYGLTDKLALTADLAYVASKYIGKTPHGPVDTGSYHPTFQDAHFDVRYNALKRTVVVTPSIGFTIPIRDYETRGHSAPGRHFRELLVGVNVGMPLDRFLRGGYVDGKYSYAILPRFHEVKLDRSNVTCEVGWFATRSLSFRFISALQKTHGGVTTPLDPELDDHEKEFHDRITRTDYLYLGGGVSFAVNKSLGVYVTYLTTTYARNVQAPGGILVGFSLSFSRGLTLRPTSTNTRPVQMPALGTGGY